jgi:hypothetical protein
MIKTPSHFSLNKLISCLKELDSLFHSANELIISISNVGCFTFLADFLDNRFLMKKCKKIKSTQTQIFKLSSKHLFCFSKSWLNLLFDFDLIINENKIGINYSLFSCISETLNQLNNQTNELTRYISDEAVNCFHSFLDIMERYSFNYETIDFSMLKDFIDSFDMIDFYPFISLKVTLPQTIGESVQFLSKPYCEFLKKQYDHSLQMIIQNFNSISLYTLNILINSHLLKIFSSKFL